MSAITISDKEREEALFEVSFNRWRALKLFSFTFASFVIGLVILYWTLDSTFTANVNTARQKLLALFEQTVENSQMTPVATDLFENVVTFHGPADFDNVQFILVPELDFEKETALERVRGEKRMVAPGVYEIRFVKDTRYEDTPDAAKEASEGKKS